MRNDPLPAEQLVEYELGLLEDPQRQELAAVLAADPALRARLESTRNIIHAVNRWEAPEPPAGMVDAIMQRVGSTSPLEYVAGSSTIDPDPNAQFESRPMFSLGEMVALAACILLVVSVFTPGMMSVRSRQLQSLCADNLAGLHRGWASYAAANDGAIPVTAQPQPPNWLNQPNRIRLRPAIRLRFIAPASLLCPTSDQKPDADNTDRNIDPNQQSMLQFLQRSGLPFYSIQNMNGRNSGGQAMRIGGPFRMPLASDANPVLANGRFHPDVDWRTNSTAHVGRGQNVLFVDGSTQFLKTPMVEPSGGAADNIWKAEHVSEYTGVETAQSATDAFLTP